MAFSNAFIFNEYVWIWLKIFLALVTKVRIKKYSRIGSDNGLAPARQQTIIWTNNVLVYWRIYASLGLNELNCDDSQK